MTPISNFVADTVVVSFGLRKNTSLDNGDELDVEYNNGTSWVLLESITGADITSTTAGTYTTFSYSSTAISVYLILKVSDSRKVLEYLQVNLFLLIILILNSPKPVHQFLLQLQMQADFIALMWMTDYRQVLNIK